MKIGKHTLTPFWGNVRLTKNKSFEYQIELFEKADDMCGNSLFGYSLSWDHKRDHAGIDFNFSVAKLVWFSVNIHDNRHWNTEKNRWCTEDDYH
jgi:hypothetical protein